MTTDNWLYLSAGVVIGSMIGMFASYLFVVRKLRRQYMEEIKAHDETMGNHVEFCRRMLTKIHQEKEEANGNLVRLADSEGHQDRAVQSPTEPIRED